MRIAVIGSSGRTGSATVAEALKRGHEVIAVARRQPSEPDSEGLDNRVADLRESDAVAAAIDGADAVISAVGIGSSREETEVYSRGAIAVAEAMRSRGIQRLVVVSASPAGPREDHPGLEHKIVLPILEMVFGASYRDMRRMELALASSCVNWVAVRPPRRSKRAVRSRPASTL